MSLIARKRLVEELDDGCVLYLPFWENAGTKTEDLSGLKHHGTLNGPVSWATGVIENGVEFIGNANTDYLSMPYQVDFRDAMTCSVWGKRTTAYNQALDVVFIAPAGAWYFYDGWSSGQIVGYVFIGGLAYATCYSAVIPNDGVWRHFAYTYDSADHYGRMYLNGTQVDSAEVVGLLDYRFDLATGNLYNIGQNGGNRGWILDELRLWNRALSPAEVFEEYYRGARQSY